MKPLLDRRHAVMGATAQLFYDDPIRIVRALGTRLWDEQGRKYLDCYNNVPCIGHCHPRYLEAMQQQMALLNTHTRYLSEPIVAYLEDLSASFSAGFDAGILTCTGSEANDIALRAAWAVTGKRGIIATDRTYHGNTHLVSQLSKNKVPIGGHEPFVRHVTSPDSYRGISSAAEFCEQVKVAINDLEASEQGFAALIICPLFANEGFPTIERGWLDATQAMVKARGGLLICDEVQSGFGRTGELWAHERIGAVPDIVTLGKPMAAGHPVGGVITHADILSTFQSQYGYFNTFGGNPVSAIAAQTTLDILRDENLVEHTNKVGTYALQRMHQLMERFDYVGDVRGTGLFFGMEIVKNRATKTTDPQRALHIVNAMRHQGVLMNRLGVEYSTLKIRPPLVFSKLDADELFDKLETVMLQPFV